MPIGPSPKGAVAGKAPGDVVRLTIERPEAGRRTVSVELIASPDDPERTIVVG